MLGPRPPRRRPNSPTQCPPIVEGIMQTQLLISELTQILVQHGSFVALSRKEVHIGDVSRGAGPSNPAAKCNRKRIHGHNSHSCQSHRCLSCRQICYGPMEASGHESFMEELIRPYSKPSTLVDALVSFSTTVTTIEATYSFWVPNTQVVVRHNDRPCPPGMDKSPPSQGGIAKRSRSWRRVTPSRCQYHMRLWSNKPHLDA